MGGGGCKFPTSSSYKEQSSLKLTFPKSNLEFTIMQAESLTPSLRLGKSLLGPETQHVWLFSQSVLQRCKAFRGMHTHWPFASQPSSIFHFPDLLFSPLTCFFETVLRPTSFSHSRECSFPFLLPLSH